MDRLEAALLEAFIHNANQYENNQVGSSNNTESQPPTRQPFQVRNVKLDFSRFDGTNVLEWIFRAEQFFDYHNTPDVGRLTIASIHMDKEVVPWYQMMYR